MRETILSDFTLSSLSPTLLTAHSPSSGLTYTLSPLSDNLLRVTLDGPTHPRPTHRNVVWADPAIAWTSYSAREGVVELATSALTITLTLPYLTLSISSPLSPLPLHADLPHRTFSLTPSGLTHYSLHPGLPNVPQALHLGLGEKAAPLDLGGRRFEMRGVDAANYDAWRSDPLYKQIPFLLSLRKGGGAATGIFSASNSDGVWDVGCEVDDPWGRYRKFAQDCGGLEEYFMFGRSARDVVEEFARLVGYPRLPSRRWLGYLASSMGYAESDDPPAQELLWDFPAKCREHGIPCSAMHLSSGYTVAMSEPKHRQVFTLNTHRYPDLPALVAHFHREGILMAPNIKPFVLFTHPHYPKLLEQGAFVKTSNGQPATTRIWSALPGENAGGCWVDMTSKEGSEWWYEGVRGLVEMGMDGMWNDNNEFTIHSDDALCAFTHLSLSHPPTTPTPTALPSPQPIGHVGRMLHTELMAQTSFEALRDAEPQRRPWVITRSANVGTLRWAGGSWSGDNWTGWRTVKGNVAMCLNAGISLMHSYGHDVGGFGGPVPTPELLLRWVQSCVYNPRFCIHSFKPTPSNKAGTSTITEPWMHPSVTPLIRTAIRRRYELVPYLYALCWESRGRAEPVNTWVGWGEFEGDPGVWDERVLGGQDFWVGTGRVLVAGVYDPGVVRREVYLPRSPVTPRRGYWDLNEPYGYYEPGWVTVDMPWEHVGVFVRAGSALPVGRDGVTVTAREGPARYAMGGVGPEMEEEGGVVRWDDWRGVEIYPPPAGKGEEEGERYVYEWTEDDGESADETRTTVVRIEYWGVSGGEEVGVEVRFVRREFEVLWGREVSVVLPRGDGRGVRGGVREEREGRVWWRVKVEGPP